MKGVVGMAAAGLIGLCALVSLRAVVPPFVDITWMSISNVYYELGSLRILTDGYITRLPQSAFFGGGGGLASTRQTFKPVLRYSDVVEADRRTDRGIEDHVFPGDGRGHPC